MDVVQRAGEVGDRRGEPVLEAIEPLGHRELGVVEPPVHGVEPPVDGVELLAELVAERIDVRRVDRARGARGEQLARCHRQVQLYTLHAARERMIGASRQSVEIPEKPVRCPAIRLASGVAGGAGHTSWRTHQAIVIGTLFIVGTPIGNLEDLSLRAARVLREADLIAAEDTRTAKQLLVHVDALGPSNRERRVISYFEGNEAERATALVEALRDGRRVAVISEAGMPGVSDPGSYAITAAIAAGARVEVIAGPSAALAALIGSGLPSDRFLFVGFPSRETGARQALFGTLRGEAATMIFYEAPDRVAATLGDLAKAFGADRRASLGRELTKIHEEHVRGTLGELGARYAQASPLGECTLVVAGAAAAPAAIDIEAELGKLLADGLGPRDAAARLVIATGKPRRQLYQLALSLRAKRD
jgi:16S rRNA (cytidine1402-2'-O)-methyltransferase